MLFVTKYTFRGDRSTEAVQAMLAVYAETGDAPGMIAHYVASDGRGGVVVAEADSVGEGYENILRLSPWLDFETTPVLKLEDAMPAIMTVYGD